MLKVLIMSDKKEDSLLLKSSKKFWKSKSYLYEGWNPFGVLTSESPNFVLFDLEVSANGDNLVNMMESFDVYCRLRITIIYPLHVNIISFKDFFTKLPAGMNNLFRHNKPSGRIREAYSRR